MPEPGSEALLLSTLPGVANLLTTLGRGAGGGLTRPAGAADVIMRSGMSSGMVEAAVAALLVTGVLSTGPVWSGCVEAGRAVQVVSLG